MPHPKKKRSVTILERIKQRIRSLYKGHIEKRTPIVSLRTVTTTDYEFLYWLLNERDSTTNISHSVMPMYRDHVRFCESKPYPFRYVITVNDFKIGTCYVTYLDEIGVFISKTYQGQGCGKAAIIKMMKNVGNRKYLANINPVNSKSKSMFESLGFKQCQVTYKKDPIE